MSQLSFKERMKQQREQEILQAAGVLIREHGYESMNMDKLAERVGISKPTLYQHFTSKEAILTVVLKRSLEALDAHLDQHSHDAPLLQLENVLRMLIEHAYRPESMMANLSARSILEIIHSDAIFEQKARVMARLCRIVDEGKAHGQIEPDIATPFLVDQLFYLLGAVGKQTLTAQHSIETATEQALRVFHKVFLPCPLNRPPFSKE